MVSTVNKSGYQFTDYQHTHEKLNRNSGSIIKRLRKNRKNKFFIFNKWFEKEHDYCLPVKRINKVSLEIPVP